MWLFIGGAGIENVNVPAEAKDVSLYITNVAEMIARDLSPESGICSVSIGLSKHSHPVAIHQANGDGMILIRKLPSGGLALIRGRMPEGTNLLDNAEYLGADGKWHPAPNPFHGDLPNAMNLMKNDWSLEASRTILTEIKAAPASEDPFPGEDGTCVHDGYRPD